MPETKRDRSTWKETSRRRNRARSPRQSRYRVESFVRPATAEPGPREAEGLQLRNVSWLDSNLISTKGNGRQSHSKCREYFDQKKISPGRCLSKGEQGQ